MNTLSDVCVVGNVSEQVGCVRTSYLHVSTVNPDGSLWDVVAANKLKV